MIIFPPPQRFPTFFLATLRRVCVGTVANVALVVCTATEPYGYYGRETTHAVVIGHHGLR
jgi:hypothetical protein